jgi:putative CocE/NonD family hydrolase
MSRLLLLLGLLLPGVLPAQGSRTTQPPGYGGHTATFQAQFGITIPMRDGVKLAADVFLPYGHRRWPAVLVRTPYNRKTSSAASYRFFAEHGFALVIEDVRGRFASEGSFGPIVQEGPDGNDTINWISEQPWSNGRVMMAGGSYLGIAQWWAAVQDNPHLLGISPICSGDDEYLDRFYSTGGALKLGHRLLWFAENFTPPAQVRPLFGSYIYHLPLIDADLAASDVAIPSWRQAIDHPSDGPYWRSFSIRDRLNRVLVPVLSFGGWFDNYAQSDLDAFSRLSAQGKHIETWIGPWAHDPALRFSTVDFGPQAHIYIKNKQLEWFNGLVNPPFGEQGAQNSCSLHLFVMGPNIWREEHEWPLARTHYRSLYLNSGGHANSRYGDGALEWTRGRTGPPDQFTYDPKKPVPTVGGAICCEPKVLPPGPLDQTAVEGRKDVLVYTTAPVSEPIEVTGPIRVVLYLATSANDTDFTAKLVDVQPDGRPLLVTDGIQRLRYRLSLTRPVFVAKNRPYQINIDAGVTSYVFERRHRIRLEMSSSNFPRFDRNLNTVLPNGVETKITKARQTVFHEPGYPSAVILPVIPDGTRQKRLETRGPFQLARHRAVSRER